MKKLFTLLTLLVAMVTSAWGQGSLTYKNDFTDGQIFWTTKANVDAAANTENDYWMVKGGKISGTKDLKGKLLINPTTDAPYTTAPYTSSTEFYIEKAYSTTNSSDQSLYIYVTGVARIFFYAWCNSTPDGRTLDITVNGEAKGSISYASGTANAQYTSVILTKAANNIIRINGSNEVELTAIKVETVEKSVSSLTFATTSGTGDMADGTSFTLPSLTKNPVDATVTYSSSATSVATVNETTGAVTLVSPGETTITASYAGDATHYPSSATYTLTVVNTAANNITVTYDISGVSGIQGTAPASFNIDEGQTFDLPASNQTLYVDGKTLTGWNDGTSTHALGATITAPATDMTLTPVFTANAAEAYLGHNASTATWQFGESNGAPSWNELQGAGSEFIYVTQTTIGGNVIDVKMSVDPTSGKIHNKGRADKWAQVNANTKLTVPAITDAVIKVYTNSSTAAPKFNGEDGDFDSTNKIYSYTATSDGDIDIVYGGNDYASKIEVVYPSENPVLIVSANTAVSLTKTNINAVDYLSVTTDNWSSNYYNMSKTDRKLSIKVKGAKAFYVDVQNTNANRTYTIKVGDAAAETVTHGGTGEESCGIYTIADPSAETTITLAGGGESVYPHNIYFYTETVDATVGTYEWATLSNATKALDFAGVVGVDAYLITGHNGTAITKTQVTGTVPANTGLLLNGEAATYKIPVAASSSTDVSANLLKAGTGSEVTPASGHTCYALSVANSKATFKKFTSATTIPTGKAYLDFAEVISAREILDIDGFSTGIENIKVGSEDNVYYNLQGQRVLYPTKGLYIVNGKKVIIK
ncbi:MAG: hypothetical protein IJ633_03240 [Prevotella sp.]|nr:hypothetical protein [Prevotella sp.]